MDDENEAGRREAEREDPSTPSAPSDTIGRLDEWRAEVAPKARNYWLRGLGFIGPIFLFLLPIPFLYLYDAGIASRTLSFYPAAAVFGVDVSAALGIAAGFTWWWVFAFTMWGQMLLCAFLLWNFNLLRRWDRADRYFAKKEKKAIEAYQRRPWLRKGHFWGLTLFTVLPLGSGIYVGVPLGKYTGLADTKTWAALMLGTAVWLLILSYFGVHFWDRFLPDWRLFG